MKMARDKIIFKAFKELFHASKTMFLVSYFLTLLQGLSRILPIVTIQKLFDHLYLLKEPGGINTLFIYILAFMVSRCVCHVIDFMTNYLYESYNMVAAYGMTNRVNKKIFSAKAINFEQKEFLDAITKSYRGTKSIRKFIDTWMLILLLYVPEISVVVVYLYKANPFLPFILLLILIPSYIVLKVQEKEYAIQEEGIAINQRKREVYEEHAFDLRSNIESRIQGYLPLLEKKISGCISDNAKLDYGYQCKKNKLENIEKLTILIGHISIFCVLLYCTVLGYITVGVFSALITTLDELFKMIEEILFVISEGVSEELEKIRNYFNLTLSTDKAEEKIKIKCLEKMEFRNVSFTYPGCKEKALDKVSFVIKKGEKVAIVGKNGSGKSTLLKLVSGIYECDEGMILVNDIDIKKVDKVSLYQLFSAVFQNYGRYALDVEENIYLNQPKNEELINDIISLPGLNEIKKIGNKEILSREFGGIDLSGGQWQRIAIARSEYRNREFYLLDEPTSAIDPNEEKVIYELFKKLMLDRTSLLVTHRMSATKLVDRIFVMNNGKLAGDGKHAELLLNCGDYQELWNSQAQIYEN